MLTRTAWSRDVRPNNSGVTYSRRSYYYDREFSDSIVRPTDRSESSLSGRSTATRYREQGLGLNEAYDHTFFPPVGARSDLSPSAGRIAKRQYEDTITRHRKSSDWFDNAFQRGRVLQSAGTDDDDDDEGVYALQDCSPPKPAQALSGIHSQVPTVAVPPESEPGLAVAGLDLQTIAQGIVVAADVLVRITEAYQRIRDSDGYGGGSSNDDAADDEFFGLNLDPYHLEAGPPRQLRSLSRIPPLRTLSARKTVAQRAQVAASSATRTASPQEDTSCQSTNTTTAKSILPPLPAGKRVCYYLIATVFFGVLASFGLALWWAQSQADVSAGFTIGGYVIAVDALVVAVVGVVHRPGCRCWKV
ncbi:hypothetical protein FHL15_001644 [Xylaria flabelliformis]|uniref:Transmembrane protein n=1 Tax=Xylaria flabelliformis TaxID=2512241 RepID=A0A553IAZ0_9PEZI|nr:hypothetical protein FHL15_001644 [Xylaria flabelliformis]